MYFFLSLCLAMIGLTASAQQSELKLTFDRSGDNVTVNVSGVEGVTATVVSKSHAWKDLGVTNANTILCPNVNGNTDPTITWALQLNGVPANYKLKGMGLDIHALNGGGNYQDPADNVGRHWNVVVAQGETTVANFADIEISQGSEAGRTMNNNHKVHTVEVADAPATTDPMTLNFTVTKGSVNLGCFFGLSEVTLTYDVEEVEVPETPEVPNAELAATYKGTYALDFAGIPLDVDVVLNFNKDSEGNDKAGYAYMLFSHVEMGPIYNAEVPYEVMGNTVVLKGVKVATEENNSQDTKEVDLTFTVQENGSLLSNDKVYGPGYLSATLIDFSTITLAPEATTPEQPEVPAGPVVITDVAQLSNAKCYTLVSSDTGRGGMYALADKVDMCGVTYNAGTDACHSVALDNADPKQQFAFVEYEGKLYLYSVSEKKFVMKSGDTNALVGEAPFEHVVVEKVGENTFALQANGTHYFTASPGWCANLSRGTCIQSTLDSHNSDNGWDNGAWYTITEVADFDATEAIAMLTPAATPLEVVSVSPSEAVNALSELTITFNQDVAGQFDPYEMSKFMKLKKDNSVASGVSNYVVDGAVLTVTLEQEVTEAGEYTLVIPEGLITRKSDGAAYSGEHKFTVAEATPEVPALELADKYTATFNTMGLDVNAELLFDQDMDGNAKEGYVTYVFNAPLASVNISECVAYETTATTVVLKNATVGGEASGSTTNVDITFTVQEDCSLIGEQKIKGPGSFTWFEVDLSTIKFVPEATTPEVPETPETPEAQDTFTYTSASPATEEVQSYMSYITLNFGGEVAEVKTDAINVVDGKGNVVTTATLEADWFDTQVVGVTFAEEVAYTGTCSLTVPAQFITSTDSTYNPEFTLTYNLEAEPVQAYFYHPEYNAVMVMDSVSNVATIKKNFTLEDMEANAWELHPVGKNQFKIANKATGLYLGACSTSVPVAGVDAANAKVYEMQKDGIYDVLKDVEGGNYNYLHVAASQSDKIVGWEAAAAASHWFVLNYVEDYEYLLANLELVDSLNQVIAKAEALKEQAKPYYKPLITSATQFTSNAKEASEGSYEALLDGDDRTFFHTEWSAATTSEAHNLQVLVPGNELTELWVKYQARNAGGAYNDRPTKMSIYGGTMAEDGTVTYETTAFANLTTADGIGEVAGEFKFTADKAYDAFKFEVHETVMSTGNTGNKWFTYGEFQMYSQTMTPADVTMNETQAAGLDEALEYAKNANPVEDAYSVLIDELNRAINKVLFPAATVESVDPACGHYTEMPGTVKLTFSADVQALEFGMVRTDFTSHRGYTLSEEDYTINGKELTVTVPAEYVTNAANMMITLGVIDANGQYVTYASDPDYLSEDYVFLMYTADMKSNIFMMSAVDPEEGEVETLEVINMTFGEGNTYVGGFDTTKEVVVLNADGNVVTKATMEVVKESEVDPDTNESFSWPTATVKFTLAAPVTEAGEYTLVVPEGTVYNESFNPDAADFGVEWGAIYNPEVRVAYTVAGVVEEYPINFDKDQDATRTDRVLSTVSLAVEGEAAQELTVANTRKAYNDMTAGEVKFVCAPGATLTPAFNYSGVWMHGYVYVDFGQDGDFSFDATTNDQTGKDLVSYSFYGVDSENYGYNSANEYISGDGRSTLVCPAFTAPETPGEYRVRFKVDWNNVDAGGCVDSNNHILNNGGYIVDATLVVDEATAINGVSIENMNDVYTLDGRKVVVKAGQKLNKGLYIVGGKKVYVK